MVFLNDGAGAFSNGTSRLPIDNQATLSVAIGDVDGDTDLDIFFGKKVSQNSLVIFLQ